ncbi:MAG TPA: alpha/beta fold hydrolase [Actinomycetota bacterium]
MDLIDELRLPESRWVDVGGPVHYRMWEGPQSGPTFVCVHGLGGSLLNWALVAPQLARHGPVVALDLAGFGLTPLEERGAGVGSNWRLLDGFLGVLDMPPVILMGNSMGAMVSLIEAAHAPERVESLVLVDAAFPRTRTVQGQFDPRVASLFALYSTSRVGEWFARMRSRRLGPEGLVRETLRVAAADPGSVDPLLVEAIIDQTRRRQEFDYATTAFLAAARSIFRAQVAPGRYRALVRSVRCPALVMHGARDRLVPVATAREAAAEHPNWKLVVFDDLGHIPQMEAPERWLGEVEQWLHERGGSQSAAGL